ncbi:MAG: cation transporter [Anaerolineales bacterium]|nr:cation transporter [Anaerolineales bacterium]
MQEHTIQTKRPSLIKFAWLSIGTAVFTIALKLVAYLLTGSVGLFSDALEGFVNLAAAIVVFITLKIVEKPPDDEHEYGHDKAEYFSSGIEGTLIVLAALSILYTSIVRLLNPQPLEQVGLGLTLALTASAINLVVGQLLIRAGKQHNSITLEADGKHLMSDVWTSVGVVVGIMIAVWSGFERLDPLIGILVGLKIGWEGFQIFRRSAGGLMDVAIVPDERAAVETILNNHAADGVTWHALRTRQSGSRRFIIVHLLVPGAWQVQEAHDMAETIDAEIQAKINYATVITHIEPVEDPKSFNDW